MLDLLARQHHTNAKEYLVMLLQRTGSAEAAASELGVHRGTVHRWMRSHHVCFEQEPHCA